MQSAHIYEFNTFYKYKKFLIFEWENTVTLKKKSILCQLVYGVHRQVHVTGILYVVGCAIFSCRL